MPLFSEHISNMYYGASPSYTSPSYGYKSSYVPLGTSYSASYLSPGGTYSNHSSLSSYSRAPLTSRWVPGMSRSYSPMLTPISERGTASPLRIHSPRRVPIAKRCYGTPSYMHTQRPININTESIDVSRDRYRLKPSEPSSTHTQPASQQASSVTQLQNDNPVKDKENGPFMPRVDGKPETGIDSSPGIQRSTIKRGRTVVRLHTIKRKDKDSPRKAVDISQDSEVNKQDFPEPIVDDVVFEEPKESLSWREKLSDDLVYVDKKEKKSLGTKLVEKFIVKDAKVKNSIEVKNSEGASQNEPENLLPSFEVPSTSKSPDRRCSMEMLAEQASLLDSLIRGENLSTASLDLSKVGIAQQPKNKFVSSDSIKRRKTDDKGNPLKTTKSDHDLHENLSKSLKGNKEPKAFTKRRSLKKSQSGGNICRLDSITEFPKEIIQLNLPAIQENKLSPKEQKTEQKPKLRTKITGSVEISPPTSPLKFVIENVTVEEKLHKPKKEISFSYEVEETPIQDVTLQGPKSPLRRTKERNSIKKKSKKKLSTDLISPEPDDGNFWAKIGKRETIYLMKRKENIEAAREANKRSHLWFLEDDESSDVSKRPLANTPSDKESNDFSNLETRSDITGEPKPNSLLSKVNDNKVKDNTLKNVSKKLEKSKSSDNMHKLSADTHNTSLKEKKTQAVAESKQNDLATDDKNVIKKNINPQDIERNKINEDIKLVSKKNGTSIDSVTDIKATIQKSSITMNEVKTNLGTSTAVPVVINKTTLPVKNVQNSDKPSILSKDLKQESLEKVSNQSKPTVVLNETTKIENKEEIALVNNAVTFKIQATEIKESRIENDIKTETDTTKAMQSSKIDTLDSNVCPEVLSQSKIKIEDNNEQKDTKKNITTETNTPNSQTTEMISVVEKEKEETTTLTKTKTDHKDIIKDSKTKWLKDEVIKTATNADINTKIPAVSELKSEDKESTSKVSSLQGKLLKEGLETTKPEKSDAVECSENSVDIDFSAEIKPKIIKEPVTLQVLAEGEVKNNVDDSVLLTDKAEKIANANNNCDTKLSNETISEPKEEISISAVKIQANNEVEETKPHETTESKQVESAKKLDSNINKQLAKSTNSSNSTDSSKPSTKKKVKKVRVKSTDKNTGLKTETKDSVPIDNICETCKKALPSEDKKTSKSDVTKVSNPIISKPLQEKDSNVDKPMNILQKSKSDSDKAVVPNTGVTNLKPETSASTSQVPIMIETKNIPQETVASTTEQVQLSKPSQEETGEQRKAEKDSSTDDNTKVKRSSVKKVSKKPVNDDKPVKPLIATPRPLLKRAPQVIHSDTSDSSSEEESSEEEEESEASENSDTGEFYECDNNPDGRTSTGSNDSGFDSSAPTSPASFLQIKKGGDSSPAPGPSSGNATSQLPDTEVDSELELEQSTAYGLFRKTGRFTPPARSIPRFRKYNIEDFQFIKVLGKGSFGKVLLAELRDTEYYYAVKCLKKDVVLEDDDVECTLIERKVLALGTNHPYLCHLFATFQTDSHLFFVMEYLNGGDLMFHIQQSGRFPEPRARFYAAEIVSGLKFLHKRGIVYRDLKLDNILLDFDGHVRIADFGMCKLQIYLDKTADTFCGTPDYMAPEIIKGLKYNQTVDWWSFGVLLYEMLIGQSPFSGCDEDELFWSICNEMPSYPRFLSRESLTILTRLLDKDAKTRLGGTECMHGDVREQDFFHPVHWDKLERRELETPFKPRVRHPLDTQYFDRAFTGERPRLTAVEPHVLRSMDQEPFRGFSYTNPNATDR